MITMVSCVLTRPMTDARVSTMSYPVLVDGAETSAKPRRVFIFWHVLCLHCLACAEFPG
jgi:hypothetical protein